MLQLAVIFLYEDSLPPTPSSLVSTCSYKVQLSHKITSAFVLHTSDFQANHECLVCNLKVTWGQNVSDQQVKHV